MTTGIKVLVLEGEHATNNIRRKVAIQPVVEVRDENDRPVEGASVIFRLPPSGPGGFFPGQKPTLTVKTDARGQAGAAGMVPNDQPGTFEINVTATAGNRLGQAVIAQTNSSTGLSMNSTREDKKPFWRNKYFLIGAAGLVTAVIIVVATHSGSNKTVTITPGPVTVNQ